jgi:hypothetical protein
MPDNLPDVVSAGHRHVLATDLFERRFEMRDRAFRITQLVEPEQPDPE